MQLLKNLYQLGGDLNGLTWDGVDAGYNDGNTYALVRDGRIILFDCGCGDTFDQIADRMAYWGLSLDAVEACLLTHAHFDHAGGAHLVKERGIHLVAHQETADAIATGDKRCAGYLYHKTFSPVTVDRIVADNEILDVAGVAIEVMHLPGHSRGCTAYRFEHEGKRIVVSGDVIGTLLAGNFGWSGSYDFDKTAYLASLTRFADVEMDLMLPGHGMVYFHEPRRRVEEALNAALMEWR